MTEVAINVNPLHSNQMYLIIISSITLIFSFIFLKPLFFITFFCVMIFAKDALGNYFKIGSPVAIIDIAAIYCSYVYSAFAGIFVTIFSLFSKLYFGRFESHHLLKAALIVINCYLINAFNYIELFILSTGVIFLRYVLEYLLDIVLIKRFDIKENINRIWRTVFTLLIIYYTKGFLLSIMA